MLYLLSLNLIPSVLIVAALFLHFRHTIVLPKRRRLSFRSGLVSGTFAAVLLILFVLVSVSDPSRIGHVNVWGGRVLVAGFLMSFVSLPLVLAGGKIERVFATLSVLSSILLLYIAGLASSL